MESSFLRGFYYSRIKKGEGQGEYVTLLFDFFSFFSVPLHCQCRIAGTLASRRTVRRRRPESEGEGWAGQSVATSHNRRSGMMGRTVLGNISQRLKLSLLPGHTCSCLFKIIHEIDRQSDYPKPTHLHKPYTHAHHDNQGCSKT